LIVISILIEGCENEPDIRSAGNINNNYYTVTKVQDGDTFNIDSLGIKITIRPIGIDAPETRKTPKEEKQCYGKEATDYLKQMILGKKVRIELDKGRFDRYHRTLAYVYLEDSIFVNAELVRKGFADTMNFAPNLKYKDLFLKLRNEAKEKNIGMWGECY